MQHAEKFLKIVNDAKTRICEMSVAQLKQLMASKSRYYLIDVREKSEWDQGSIPHALHLSKGLLEANIEKIVPGDDATIVLYCGGGFRSALAADNLQKMGYDNVFSLAGGYHAWSMSSQEMN